MEHVGQVQVNSSIHQDEQYVTESEQYKQGEKVRNYKEKTVLKYPNVVLHTDSIEMHIAQLLKSMTVSADYTLEDGYLLYVEIGGNYAEVGLLASDRIESIMSSVFDKFKRVVNLDINTSVEGDLINALCPPKAL